MDLAVMFYLGHSEHFWIDWLQLNCPSVNIKLSEVYCCHTGVLRAGTQTSLFWPVDPRSSFTDSSLVSLSNCAYEKKSYVHSLANWWLFAAVRQRVSSMLAATDAAVTADDDADTDLLYTPPLVCCSKERSGLWAAAIRWQESACLSVFCECKEIKTE